MRGSGSDSPILIGLGPALSVLRCVQVLIANNGMAATKSILSMRQWAYMELGDDRAIEFIVMATPEDLNANAEFIRLADRFVEVGGSPWPAMGRLAAQPAELGCVACYRCPVARTRTTTPTWT